MLEIENKLFIRIIHLILVGFQEAFEVAPPHLIRSEFSLDLAAYNHLIKEMEKELISEQQAFTQHDDIEMLLAKHNVSLHFFTFWNH